MVVPLVIPAAKLGEALTAAGSDYFSAKAVVYNAPAISKAVDSAINSDEAADDADKADAPPIADTCSACQPPEEPPPLKMMKKNL